MIQVLFTFLVGLVACVLIIGAIVGLGYLMQMIWPFPVAAETMGGVVLLLYGVSGLFGLLLLCGVAILLFGVGEAILNG